MQVLEKDLAQIERLVTSAVADLAEARQWGGSNLDKCQVMDTMLDNHIGTLIPRGDACSSALTVLCQRCIDDKVRCGLQPDT